MSAVVERPEGLVKLSGVIRNYKVTRASANFVFTDADKTKLGVVAIAAGIAGLSGQAISAGSSASAEEDADYVEFELGNVRITGWVWRSPFSEGDEVDVAAEWQVDHYEAAGILTPTNRTIALYPHCSRGTIRHITNAAKWWLVGTTGLMVLGLIPGLYVFSAEELAVGYPLLALGFYAFFGLATISMTRQWMLFARLAEKVFRTLELPNPSNIDLVKSSKAQRKPDDPGEFGTFYFRY